MREDSLRRKSQIGPFVLSGLALIVSLSVAGCAQNGGALGTLQTEFSGVETGSTGTISSETTRAVITRARDLQINGNAKTAAQMLGQAYVKSPKDQELRRAYAIAALDSGNAKLAYKVSLNKKPDDTGENDPRLLSIRGASLSVLGHHDKAEQAFAQALALSPDDPDLMNNLAMALALKGDAKTAESLLRRAANSGPDNVSSRARENLALVVGLQGRHDEATGILKSVSAGPQKSPTSRDNASAQAVVSPGVKPTARSGLGGPEAGVN